MCLPCFQLCTDSCNSLRGRSEGFDSSADDGVSYSGIAIATLATVFNSRTSLSRIPLLITLIMILPSVPAIARYGHVRKVPLIHVYMKVWMVNLLRVSQNLGGGGNPTHSLLRHFKPMKIVKGRVTEVPSLEN